MSDRLWAPWRSAYVSGASTTSGCIFCDAGARDEDPLVLFRGALCYIILNLYPYNCGHLMVVPRRHVGALADTNEAERVELMSLTRRAEIGLTEAYRPQGLNVGMNLGRPAGAGVLDHLHMHLVPRWNGDTNFMSVIGQVRVLPEDLHASADKLRPIFERLASDELRPMPTTEAGATR